jgi:glycosyltransferase involved in cell wall biosynthesis
MVILDGDGQHDPSYIPLLLNKMAEDHADVVIGSRFLEKTKNVPLYRRCGMRALDLLTSFASSIKVTDSQSGYRAYGSKAIARINIMDTAMGAGSEILTQIQGNGLRISEAPIIARYDLNDTSSQNPISHGIDVLDTIIWHIAQKRPLLVIGIPGFVSIAAAIFLGIHLLRLYNEVHFFSVPLALITSLFLILGTMGLFMGMTFNIISRIIPRLNK